MAQQRTDDGAITVRLSDDWIHAVDARATKLEQEMGARFSRSDIVRMALARYLGLVQPPPDGDEIEQPQATP